MLGLLPMLTPVGPTPDAGLARATPGGLTRGWFTVPPAGNCAHEPADPSAQGGAGCSLLSRQLAFFCVRLPVTGETQCTVTWLDLPVKPSRGPGKGNSWAALLWTLTEAAAGLLPAASASGPGCPRGAGGFGGRALGAPLSGCPCSGPGLPGAGPCRLRSSTGNQPFPSGPRLSGTRDPAVLLSTPSCASPGRRCPLRPRPQADLPARGSPGAQGTGVCPAARVPGRDLETPDRPPTRCSPLAARAGDGVVHGVWSLDCRPPALKSWAVTQWGGTCRLALAPESGAGVCI